MLSRFPHPISIGNEAATLLQCIALLAISSITASAQANPSVAVGQDAFFTVPISFASTETLGKIDIVTKGAFDLDFRAAVEDQPGINYCAVGQTYNAGATCDVRYVFEPTAMGARYGAIVLFNTDGAPVVTKYLQGTGTGQQLSFFGPNYTFSLAFQIESAVYPNGPIGIAVDETGDLFLGNDYNNAALKMVPSASGYSTLAIGDNLYRPWGIALDGAGNTYIAETGKIVKDTLSNAIVPQTTLATNGANDIAIDGAGDVFFFGYTSSENGIIEAVPDGFGGYSQRLYSTAFTDTSALVSGGIAVDGKGNLFVIPDYDTSVIMIPPSDPNCLLTIHCPTIAQGLNGADGIAVDGVGDVFIANSGGHDVLEEIPTGGTFAAFDITGLSDIEEPTGVAADRNGNVYIADSANSDVAIAQPTQQQQRPLNFVTVPSEGITESTNTVLIRNGGTQNVTLRVPAVTLPADFYPAYGTSTAYPDCTDGLLLTPDAVCAVGITFDPPPSAAGTINGTGTVDSSAGSPTIQLSGFIETESGFLD